MTINFDPKTQVVCVQTNNDKARVFIFDHEKFADGKRNFLDEPSFKEVMNESKDWFIVTKKEWSDLKKHPKKESRVQIFCKDKKLFLDEKWEFVLMPPHLIKSKFISRLSKTLDEHLENKQQDQLKIFKLFRDKEKCHDWDELQWYQQALINLNEKVELGEPDKPIIRQKLEEKINELQP